MAGVAFVSAGGTAVNRPWEYGPHWRGFGDRFGTGETYVFCCERRVGGLSPRTPATLGSRCTLTADHVPQRTHPIFCAICVRACAKCVNLLRRREGSAVNARLGGTLPMRPAFSPSQPALRAESKSRSEFPRLILNAMCSAISSARISSLVRTFFPKNSIRFCFSSARRPGSSVVWRAADEWCEEKAIMQNCRKCVFHRKAASTGQKALTLRHIER